MPFLQFRIQVIQIVNPSFPETFRLYRLLDRFDASKLSAKHKFWKGHEKNRILF